MNNKLDRIYRKQVRFTDRICPRDERLSAAIFGITFVITEWLERIYVEEVQVNNP